MLACDDRQPWTNRMPNPQDPGAQTAHAASPFDSQPAMRRAVGRWQLFGLSINDVIGSGIYLLPAAAADRKSVVEGKSVAGRVELGGRRHTKTKITKQRQQHQQN